MTGNQLVEPNKMGSQVADADPSELKDLREQVKWHKEARGLNEKCMQAYRTDIATLEGQLAELLNQMEQLREALALGVKVVDEVLPQAGRLAIDIGLLNNFLMQARAVGGKA